MFWRKGGWIGILLIGAAMVAGWVWHVSGGDARALVKDGVPVTAQLIALDDFAISTPGAGGARRAHQSYTATVRYIPPGGGADLTEVRPVSPAFFESHRQGQELTIRVLPDDPAVIEVEPGFVAGNAAAAGWVGLVTLALGVAAGGLSWRTARRSVGLDVRGIDTVARVTKREGAKGVIMLTLVFTPQGSVPPATAHVILRKGQPGATLDVGETARLRYDPADPTNARLL